MIEKIRIKNFQVHKDLSINFCGNINTIVGSSDKGKSSVIRALLWVCTNKPSGLQFVKHGSRFAEVTVTIGGREITRRRGRSVNLYFLDGKEYKAFGNNVPEEIAELVNINSINIQNQHDPSFWFSDNAGAVSKQLNQVVNLDIIDDTFSRCNTLARQTKTEYNYVQNSINENEAKLSKLQYVVNLDKKLKSLKDQQNKINKLTESVEKGRSLGIAVYKHTKTLQKLTDRLKKAQDVEKILLALTKVTLKTKNIQKLINNCVAQQELINTKLPDLDLLSNLKNTLVESKTKIESLESMINSCEVELDNINENTKELEVTNKQLNKLKQGKCPLCGK